MRETIYRKGFNGLIKDVDTEKGIVTGYFSKYNFKDSDGDVILPGAAKKTIAENGPNGKRRIYHLLQHNVNHVLGEPYLLEEKNDGIYFEGKISTTTLGKDVLILYRDGVYKEHSIGFNVIQEEYSEKDGANLIKEIRLWEGSTVTWGANEMARVTGMKSEEAKKELLERFKALEKAIRDGNFRDETFRLLEYDLKCISQALRPQEEAPKPPREERDVIEIFKQSFLNNL